MLFRSWKWDLVTQQKSACGHSIRKVLPGLSSLSPCHPQGPAPTVYLPGQMTSLVSWVTGALQPFSPGCAGSQPSRASQAFVVASQGVCEMLDAVEAPCCQERSETGASEPPHTCRATCPLPRHSPTHFPAHCGLRAQISLREELAARTLASG